MEEPHMMARSLLDVHMGESESSRADMRRSFTVFRIDLTSHMGQTWNTYKRYSEFYDLHKKLQKNISTLNAQYLPILPPKKSFGVFDPAFIEQRRKDLQNYLMELLSCPPDISLHPLVYNFLEVPESTLSYLRDIVATLREFPDNSTVQTSSVTDKRGAANNTNERIAIPSFSESSVGDAHQTTQQQYNTAKLSPRKARFANLNEAGMIQQYMNQLSDFPSNKVATLKEFDRWLFTSKLNLTDELAAMILVGNYNNGLIFEVGALDKNVLSSIMALRILCKLTSLEYCVYAKLFKRTLCLMDPTVYLKGMRLQKLLRLNYGATRRDALNILIILSSTLSDSILAVVLSNDPWAVEEFRRWREISKRKNVQSLVGQPQTSNHFLRQEPTVTASLTNREYERSAKKAFTTLQTLLSSFAITENDQTDEGTANAFKTEAAADRELADELLSDLNISKSAVKESLSEDKSPTLRSTSIADMKPNLNATPGRQMTTDAEGACGSEELLRTWKELVIPQELQRYKISIGYHAIKHSEKLDERLYIVRGVLSLPFNHKLVAAALIDFKSLIDIGLENSSITDEQKQALLRLRGEHWNTKIRYFNSLERINDCTEILDCSLEASYGPHMIARFCILKSTKYIERHNSFLVVYSSTSHPSCQQEHKRSSYIGNPLFIPTQEKHMTILSSGLSVAPTGGSSTLINFSAMIPASSILALSGELLGESSHVWNSLKNLLILLELLSPIVDATAIPSVEKVMNSIAIASPDKDASACNSPKEQMAGGYDSLRSSSLLFEHMTPMQLAKTAFMRILDE